MITVLMLALIENNLCFSESLGITILEWCVETILFLPFYHKKWHGIKGYFKALGEVFNILIGNYQAGELWKQRTNLVRLVNISLTVWNVYGLALK